MRLLLVEDDNSLSMAVAYHLKKAGFEVTRRADGEGGLEALEERHHDLVVLDRMMPVMSGDEMLRRLRKAHSDLPVIMLTAMDKLLSSSTSKIRIPPPPLFWVTIFLTEEIEGTEDTEGFFYFCSQRHGEL